MRVLLLMMLCICVVRVSGQDTQLTVGGFPSLSVRANSRSMAMGDNGMATSVGTGSLLYNPAIAAFSHYQQQLSFSYMPWLTGVASDVRMMHAGYLHSLTETSFIGLMLSYLDLGQIDLRDNNGATLASYRARDYHFDVSYAVLLADQHSLSVSLKFLGQNQFAGGSVNHYGLCGDLSYYGFIRLGSLNRKLQFGAVLGNLGSGDNLPTTAALGIGYSSIGESGDRFVLGIDASRLVKDDWKGVRVTAGMEYGFAETFFIRGGLSLENKTKGDRKFFSLGAGYKGYVLDEGWDLDVHYLIPFDTGGGVSPFQNDYGITLSINIGNYQ